MTSVTAQQQAITRTRDCIARAESHFGITLPRVEIRFDIRGKAAGMVLFPHRQPPVLRYNPVLLQENLEDFLRRTVAHEVAHLVARQLHGGKIRPHGAEWRDVMAFFGAPASRCHQYDTSRTSRRRLKRFDYRCDCQRHQLTSIRHHRVIGQQQRYYCRACKGLLVAVDKAQ